MQKLSKKEKEEIKGGSITGALFTGLGNMFTGIGNMFQNIVGSISSTVYMFTDRNQHHTKANYKIGSNDVNFDDSKQVDYDKEELKQTVKQEEHHSPEFEVFNTRSSVENYHLNYDDHYVETHDDLHDLF